MPEQTPTDAAKSRFEPCEVCGAPLDHQQRYCVSCAARRSDPSNPATRYFAAASRRARLASAASKRPAASGSQFKASAVAVLLLLPAAVGGGVLVGRSGNDDKGSADLAAAIRDGGLASNSSATTDDSALTSNSTGGTVTSDFSLDKGYTVELTTIDGGSDQDAVDKAKTDAEGKGAKDVGAIIADDYAVTPDPGGDIVIYSGEFDKKPDADKALGDLKKDFPDAKVVAVKSASSTGGGGDDNTKNGAGGDLVEQSDYGDVHKVEGAEPTDADQDEGTQIAQDQADSTGEDYIDTQQGLPDVIAVGAP